MEYDTLVFGATYAYSDPDPATEDVTRRYLSAYAYVDDINGGVYGPYASNDYQTLFVSQDVLFDISVDTEEDVTVSEDCETAFGDEGTATVSGGVSATDDLACDIAISVDTTDGTQFGDADADHCANASTAISGIRSAWEFPSLRDRQGSASTRS